MAIGKILENFIELSNNEVSLRSTSAIFDNELEDVCQKEISNKLSALPDQICLNNRILKFLESMLSYKRKHILFLESFIFRNFQKLLKMRQGYFLLRKFVKNAKDEDIQLKIIEQIIKLHKSNFTNVNGSLLGQCVIMNFQLQEIDEYLTKTIDSELIVDGAFDEEYVFFKDFLKSNSKNINSYFDNQILSIKDFSKQIALENKLQKDYFRRKLIEKNKKQFDKKYIIVDKNSSILKFLNFAVDKLLLLNHNKHSFKLINAIINYCRKDFQKILIERLGEIFSLKNKSLCNLKHLLIHKLISNKKGINIMIDCVKTFNEEGNIRLNQIFFEYMSINNNINKINNLKMCKEDFKIKSQVNKEIYIKEKNIGFLTLFKNDISQKYCNKSQFNHSKVKSIVNLMIMRKIVIQL